MNNAETAAELARFLMFGDPPAITRETYRGFSIYRDTSAPPEFAWAFAHPDYDGGIEPRDHRYGHAATPEACKAEIDALLEEAA